MAVSVTAGEFRQLRDINSSGLVRCCGSPLCAREELEEALARPVSYCLETTQCAKHLWVLPRGLWLILLHLICDV